MAKFGVYQLSTVFGPRLRAETNDLREAREEMERLSQENRSGMFIVRKIYDYGKKELLCR